MTLMRFDPFRELDRLGERALTGGMRAMPTEAFRRGDEFFVLIDLPGAEAEDIDVTVERNVVNVQSIRTSPHQEGDQLLVDERPHGRLSRQFFLGDNLDSAKVHADYDRGVLTLTIPIAAESKPRQIKIGSAEGQSRTAEVDAGSRPAQHEQQPANA